MGTYVVRRILNNNAFVSVDANGQEIVVMGKGIVFQKSGGDRIPCSRAEQLTGTAQQLPCGHYMLSQSRQLLILTLIT